MILSCSLSLSMALVPGGDSIAPDRLDAIRARWDEAMRATKVPGLAVAGVKDGKVAFIECLGVRRPDGDGAIDPDTYFYIASITKTYVATAAMILEEKGRLAISDPVKRHVPRFALADAQATATITIEDLLCHKPALEFGPLVFRDAYSGQIDDDIYFELLSYIRPGNEPQYTNPNLTLVGRVLEAVAADGRYGQWRDVLKEHLFEPLGMTRTTGYASIAWGDPNAAFPTEGTRSGSVILPHKSDRTMHAAGGLCTTASDAAKYLLFHLGDGTAGGKRVLSTERLHSMRARRTTVAPESVAPHGSVDGFGLAWQIGQYRGKPMYAHGGGYAGASAYFAILPDDGVGVAVFVNRSSSSCSALALTDALDVLLGVEPEMTVLDSARRAGANARWNDPSPTPRNPASEPGALTLAAENYAGRYLDDRFGELEVIWDGTALRLRLGDYDCALDTTGKDAFDALHGPLQRIPGAFELSDDGKEVEYVRFTPLGETVLFERE